MLALGGFGMRKSMSLDDECRQKSVGTGDFSVELDNCVYEIASSYLI